MFKFVQTFIVISTLTSRWVLSLTYAYDLGPFQCARGNVSFLLLLSIHQLILNTRIEAVLVDVEINTKTSKLRE